MKRSILTLSCLAGLAFNASANEELAQSWQWKKLLQYNENGVSEVVQDDFFFSDSGATQPGAELAATLQAFNNDPDAICRFPARHMLTTKAGLTTDFDYTQCDDFIDWQQSGGVDTAKLVFADGYLKNPASFHGHLFITLNGEQTDTGLLDNSLNYGAKVPDGVDPVTYIVKGLFGGYQARYSAQPFYRHNLSYGQIELRNLWDYELALDDFNAQLLSAHLFELSRTEYTYYFTSKNCAYYVARALELVADDYLVSDDELTVFPSEIIQRIASPERNLVRSITLNESEQKRFQSMYHALSSAQQQAMRDHIAGQKNARSFTALNQAEQKQVLITLASYFNFRQRQQPDEKQFQTRKRETLLTLLQYPAGNNHKIKATAEQPHLGQKANMARITQVVSEHGSDRFELTMRPTYYDRLQPKIGKPKHSALKMGEVTLSYQDDNIKLENLTAVSITSFNVSSTGLPGDGGNSWALRVGADRAHLRGNNPRLSAYVEGDYGKAIELTDSMIGYGLIGGRVHDKQLRGDAHNITGHFIAGVEGVVAGQNWYCEAKAPVSINQSVSAQRWVTECGASIVNGQSFDLRFNAKHQNDTNVSLGASYYF